MWLAFNSYLPLDLYRQWSLFGLCLRGVNNAQFQFIGTSAARSKADSVGPHAAALIFFVLNRFCREVAARNVGWFTGYEERHASVLSLALFRINAVTALKTHQLNSDPSLITNSTPPLAIKSQPGHLTRYCTEYPHNVNLKCLSFSAEEFLFHSKRK